MNRFVTLGLLAAFTLTHPGLAPAADAPHIGEGGVPQFERDRSWPKLPAAWNAGASVSAVAIDPQNEHVWLLTRPRSLPKETPASAIPPAVVEFDANGNYVKGWGGQSGSGYAWPGTEHGLTIDSKGFLWIIGTTDSSNAPPNSPNAKVPNDSQILKFSKDGKFVMAIGKPGMVGSNKTDVLRGAANTFYHEKTNELYVADGYGNSRIIIFDADSGKVKRQWGAYGKPALDMADRPKRAEPNANPWVAVSEVLQQFQSPLHDVKVSDDGLVYAADRGNKRVQVFTPDGKFIGEQFVGLNSAYPLQVRSLNFSPDQRFLYLGGTPVTYILNRKTLEVLGEAPSSSDLIGHSAAVDKAGNLYLVQAQARTPDSPFGAQKYAFKGYSPTTK